MSWDEQRSRDRIASRWAARDKEVTVTKLTRDMNLQNVTLHNGRLIHGAHLYVTVAATGQLHLLDTDDHAISAIQRTALWQSEVSKIAADFDVPIIAFQGGRVHLLVFRPIADDAQIARKAVLIGRAISLMTAYAFNPLFDEEHRLNARAAADLGQTVATRAGTRGDSELLFLGSAANRPAKLLGDRKMLVTGRLRESLTDDLTKDTDEIAEQDAFALKLSQTTIEESAAAAGIQWTVQQSADRLAADLAKWPLDRFKVSGATTLIDPAKLGRSDSKLVDAAVIVVDIDGFSAYIDEAENDEIKRDRILTLDAIRQEMRSVLKSDFNGVRIQYQGDNMIGLLHLPSGDKTKIAKGITDIAAAIESSMSITLPATVPDAARLRVAVGISLKRTVVSRLGTYADRDALLLGPAVTKAERIQILLAANHTGIDKATYDELAAERQPVYTWNASAGAYVGESVDLAKLERVQESLSANDARTITPTDRPGYSRIGAAAGARVSEAEHVRPLRPYADR